MSNLLDYIDESINTPSPIIIYVDIDGVLADLNGEQISFIVKNYEDIFKQSETISLNMLSKKEKINILKNIFSKKIYKITNEQRDKVKSIYWQKFIDNKCFEKLKVLSQVKILSHTLKEIKQKYPDIRIEILGSTGHHINHHVTIEQKKKWLEINKDKININFDKYNFVPGKKLKQGYASRNTILIDDTLSNCQEFNNGGGKSFHVDKNMNELTEKLEIYIKKIKEAI